MSKTDPLGVAGMFRQRMEREGRAGALDGRIQTHLDAGASPRNATRLAMKEMGFVSNADEMEQYWTFLSTQDAKSPGPSPAPDNVPASPIGGESRAVWSAAMRLLPNTAALTLELDWIGAHPCMSQRSLGSDDVQVTVDDVLRPPHGRAPSKRAVNQLLHWVHKPGDFFKMIVVGRKKTSEGEDGETVGVVKDLGLEEVRRILDQMEEKG